MSIERRWSDADLEKMQRNAQEIVASKPDVILVQSTPMVAAMRKATPKIPIVFVRVSDPVGSGFIASFARPGGNVTGFTDIEPSLASKWIELLKEAVPAISRMALLFNPDTAPDGGLFFLRPFQVAAASFGVRPMAAAVHDIKEVEIVLSDLSRGSDAGLVCQAESFVNAHVEEIVSLARRFRIPAMYPDRLFAEAGGMMSYGSDALDQFRRAAGYVDRVLKGAHSGDLPVEAPAKYELLVNLKTAKALGITVPPTLLARADVAIE